MYEVQKRKIINYMGLGLYNILKCYDCYIAGGAVRSVFENTEINDLDIYLANDIDIEKLHYRLLDCNFKDTFAGPNAYSMKDGLLKIQIIRKPELCYKDVNELFHEFDFYCCMGAFIPSKSEFVLHEYFLQDIASRTLRFNVKTRYPICSLYRVFKYQKKGYNLPALEMVKLSLSLNHIDLKNLSVLKDQLNGVDTIFLQEFTDRLDGKEYDYDKIIDELNDYHDKMLEDVFEGTSKSFEEFDDWGFIDD